jgi:hypothetical protein
LPEDAALASFPESAGARLLWVEPVDDSSVLVHVDTEPSHPMQVSCRRYGELWYEIGDSVE